jgi:hypothetical protein
MFERMLRIPLTCPPAFSAGRKAMAKTFDAHCGGLFLAVGVYSSLFYFQAVTAN